MRATRSVPGSAALWLLACLWGVVACGGGPGEPPRAPASVAAIDTGASVGEQLVVNQQLYWQEQQFVELVPPIPLPSVHAGSRVITLLRVPHDGAIGARRHDDEDRWVLVYPPGTLAERVAFVSAEVPGAWTVSDARGAETREGEQQLRVLRPLHAEAYSPLVGLSWRRGDVRARTEVYARLDAQRRRVPEPFRTRLPRSADRLRPLDACPACHHDAAEVRLDREASSNRTRLSDTAGWFTPLAVLSQEALLEDVDAMPQRLRPMVSLRCADGSEPVRDRCASGAPALARYALARAVSRRDPHALRVCQSRRYLFDRSDGTVREAFRGAFAECGIVEPAPVDSPSEAAPEPAAEPPPEVTTPRRRRRPRGP